MANAPQMKIPIGADTSDFDKGARKVKQEMKDLEKVSGDAFGAIGAALGVDTTKLNQFSSALSGLGNKLKTAGSEGASAFGSILTAIGPLAGAIAGLGIGTATAAFKLLNSEAEAFKNTVAGANLEMATAAYIETYRQAIHDWNEAIGQGAAQLESSAKKSSAKFWMDIKEFLMSGAFGALMEGNEGWTPLDSNFAPAMEEYSAAVADATQKAETAGDVTSRIYELERKRKENAIEIAKINAQIADQLSVARDTTADATARATALSNVESLIEQKRRLTVPLEQELAGLYAKRSEQAKDSVEAADASLAQSQRAWEVDRQITVESNSLLRVKASIATAVGKEAEEQEKINNMLREQQNLRLDKLPSVRGGGYAAFEDYSLAFQNFSTWIAADAVVEVPVKLAPPQNREEIVKTITDISQEIESIVNDMAVSVGESLGTLIGDLINGEDPWQNFANSALSAFGDLAVSVGKMAIQTGVATLGIKAALESLNGYVAIAAGVALVALGTAVKTGLSNAANGNYSSGASVATSNASSSITSDYEQRDVYVKVTGTLEADGDQLVAVINNSNKKTQFTT